MATIQINLEAQDNLRRSLIQTREEIVRINSQIAQNNKLALDGDKATRASIASRNARLRAEKALLTTEQQRQSLTLSGLRTETTQLKNIERQRTRSHATQQRQLRQQENAIQRISSANQGLLIGFTASAAVATRVLGGFTKSLIVAAANMQTYRSTIEAATSSSEEAERVFNRVLETTVDLVGIQTGDFVQFTARLIAAGVAAEDTETSIVGVTKALAQQGKSAEVTRLVLEQIAQEYSEGGFRATNLKTAIREIPGFFRIASEAIGEQVKTLEDLRKVSERFGGDAALLTRILTKLGQVSRGADLETFNAQIDILQDSAAVLADELGQHLVPIIVSFLKEINIAIQYLKDLDDRWQRLIAFTAAGATGLAALATVVGGVTLAIGAMNAALAISVGATGFAGLAAVGGSLVAVFNPVTLAILATAAAIAVAIVKLNEISRVQTTSRIEIITPAEAQVFDVTLNRMITLTGQVAEEHNNLVKRIERARGRLADLAKVTARNTEEQKELAAAIQFENDQIAKLTENLGRVGRASDNVNKVSSSFKGLTGRVLESERAYGKFNSQLKTSQGIFSSIIAAGVATAAAAAKAFNDEFGQIPAIANDSERQARGFTGELKRSSEQASILLSVVDDIVRRVNEAADASKEVFIGFGDEREAANFQRNPGRDVVGEGQREAGQQGREFIRDRFNDQLKQEETDVTESLNRKFAEYEKFYSRISSLAVSALSGDQEAFDELFKSLLAELIRGIISVTISRQIAAAKETAIDNQVTALRIANQRRIQAAISQTNALSSGGGGSGLAAGALSVGGASLGGPVGTVAALAPLVLQLLGGSQPLFHNPFFDLRAERSGRESASRRDQDRNSSDFSRYFTKGFSEEASAAATAAGQGPSNSQPREVVINFNLEDRTIQQVKAKIDELEIDDRV